MSPRDIVDAAIDGVWSLCPPYVVTVGVVVLLGGASARLLWMAARGRLELAHPRCAACGHSACRSSQDRCSECGARFRQEPDLAPNGLAFGWRRPWWRCAVAALACLGVATLVGAVFPLRAEMLLERATLAAALRAGCRGPTVLGGLARSIQAGLGGAAIEERLVDELLPVLGSDPQELLRTSPALGAAYAKLGQQCIDRGALPCAERLADAGVPPPDFHLRRRWRVGEEIRIEVQSGSPDATGNTDFVPAFHCDQVLLDGRPLRFIVEARWGGAEVRVPAIRRAPGITDPSGVRHLELRWRQRIDPAAAPSTRPWQQPMFPIARGWNRAGSFEANLEIVDSADPVMETTSALLDDPWAGDLKGRLLRLELRDVDRRMLVVCGIRRRVVAGVAVAGRWYAVQDGIDRPLHAERPWPCADPRVLAGREFDVEGSALIEPRLDPRRPFTLRFVSDPALATESSADRCWGGTTEIVVEPETVIPSTGTADPTWEMRPTTSGSTHGATHRSRP